MRRRFLWPLVIVVGGVSCVAIAAVDSTWHARATIGALDRGGYGERVIKRTRHGRCRWGSASMAFLAQGGRVGRETEGYVCTDHFGSSSIHEGPLDRGDGVDWEP